MVAGAGACEVMFWALASEAEPQICPSVRARRLLPPAQVLRRSRRICYKQTGPAESVR